MSYRRPGRHRPRLGGPAGERPLRRPRAPAGADPTPDVTDEATLARAAAAIDTPLAMVMVTTGLLHDDQVRPERDWRELDGARPSPGCSRSTLPARRWSRNTSCRCSAARTKPCSPRCRRAWARSATTRLGGWYGYRASKAALNQLIRCLAIELARKNRSAVCVGLHPGTVRHRAVQAVPAARTRGQTVHPAGVRRASVERRRPAHPGGQRRRVRVERCGRARLMSPILPQSAVSSARA